MTCHQYLIRLLILLSMFCLSAVAGEKQNVILSLGDKSYTTEDLTLVDQEKVKRALQKAEAMLKDNGYRVNGSPLGSDTFERDAAPDPERYYDGCLKVITEKFLALKLLERFEAKYNTEGARFYDEQKMFEAARQYREIRRRYRNRVRLPAIKKDFTFDEYWQRLLQVFPEAYADARKKVKKFKKQHYEKDFETSETRPYKFIEQKCFPRLVNGKLAPWYKSALECNGLKYQVKALLEKEPELRKRLRELHKRLEEVFPMRLADLHFLFIEGLPSARADEAEGVLRRKLGHNNELPPAEKLEVAIKDLVSLAGSVSVRRRAKECTDLRKKWDLKDDELLPRTLIPVGDYGKQAKNSNYVYIFYWRHDNDVIGSQPPEKKPSVSPTGQPIRLKLLYPLAEELKSEIHYHRDWELPDKKTLTGYALACTRIPGKMYGHDLPDYVLKSIDEHEEK